MGYQNDHLEEAHPRLQKTIFETEEVFWTKNRFSRPGYVLARKVRKGTPHNSTMPDKKVFKILFPRRPEKIFFGDFCFWSDKMNFGGSRYGFS